jgi:phage-related tail fiber protein
VQFKVSNSGDVTVGTWNATPIAVAYGGTGATTAADARANLGLAAVAASGSASDISAGTLSALRLPSSGVTAGTYTSVTVDATGRVTDGTSSSSGGKPLGLILALT